MPIVRDDLYENRFPYIYEIFFILNGVKTISYIGKTVGTNTAYVSGSSELTRVIANTALYYGEREAESGWHRSILASFPVGTDHAEIVSEEKRLIVESYEECRRLGPGRCWEILNKTHLKDIWRSSADTVLAKIRANTVPEQSAPHTRVDRPVHPPVEFRTWLPTSSGSRHQNIDHFGGVHDYKETVVSLEANFLQKASTKVGAKVHVPAVLMAYPGLKRASVKLRVLFAVIIELLRTEAIYSQAFSVRITTLKYVLKEPNFSPDRMSKLTEELSLAVGCVNR